MKIRQLMTPRHPVRSVLSSPDDALVLVAVALLDEGDELYEMHRDVADL